MSNLLAVARASLTGRGAVAYVCFDVPVLPCVQIILQFGLRHAAYFSLFIVTCIQ